MGTASALIAAFVMTVLVVALVLGAALVFRMLQNMSHAHHLLVAQLIAANERLLDRFQAIRWEDFAALRAAQDDQEEGGFFAPTAEPTAQTLEDEMEAEIGSWGSVSMARDRLRALEEEQLLKEDFPE